MIERNELFTFQEGDELVTPCGARVRFGGRALTLAQICLEIEAQSRCRAWETSDGQIRVIPPEPIPPPAWVMPEPMPIAPRNRHERRAEAKTIRGRRRRGSS